MVFWLAVQWRIMNLFRYFKRNALPHSWCKIFSVISVERAVYIVGGLN